MNKLVTCKTCGSQMAAKAKVCPSCGAKNKKPFYKRVWFIALVLIVVLGILGSKAGSKKETTSSDDYFDIVSSKEVTESANKTSASKAETKAETKTELVNGMRPEFKEAMDSYEAFYDEYCNFMKEYEDNSSDFTLLAKYSEMLLKLSDMDKKFEAWEDEDLNDAELAYYIEVNARVSTKLLQVAS